MMSFRPGVLDQLALPMATGWLLSDIGESKGCQQLFARQAPRLLRALREAALVQSVESSNRIEGVTVAAERLRPLVIGGAKPKDRSEEDWKRLDNDIIELRAGAAPVVRFRPVAAAAAPAALDELAVAYRHAVEQAHAPDLVLIGSLVFDFLCIHPFRDGNGRVARSRPYSPSISGDTRLGGTSASSDWSKRTRTATTNRSGKAWKDGTKAVTTYVHG